MDTSPPGHFERLKVDILYVDDDEEDFLLTADLLSASETIRCRIQPAHSAADAQELLLKENFDVLIFDNQLGDSNGIELLKWTRSERIYTPVIFLTGQGDSSIDMQAMDAGASDFLVKREISLSLMERSIRYAIERAKVEDVISRDRERYRNIVSQIPDAILRIDLQGNIEYASPVIENVLGFIPPQVIGKSFIDLVYEEDRDQIIECLSLVSCNKQLQIRFLNSEGKLIWVQAKSKTVEHRGRKAIFCVLTDVTDKRLLEIQLLNAQKLESIGQLAAGIAHEINTPCQFVRDNLSFLKDAYSDLGELIELIDSSQEGENGNGSGNSLKARVKEKAEEIDLDFLRDEIPLALNQSLDGISRVSKLVKAMKDFSHPSQETKTPSNINECIETTCTVARNEWKYVADLVTDFDDDLTDVPIYTDEFNQVILNIVNNAAHAIADVMEETEEKGTITIRTRRLEKDAEIKIIDSGKGIPPEVQSRIFDPFFTTKGIGKGTGQGLSISRSVIVERHQGNISFESEPGRGTTFYIRVPLVDLTPDSEATV